MNENNPIPPQIPGANPFPAPDRPLGDDPAERAPIPHTLAAIDALLRHPRQLMFQLRQPEGKKLIPGMIFAALLCCAVYGVVVGTFSGGVQLWAAPVKIVGGLIISASICLPSLYIFVCLSGSKARLIEVVGLLAGLVTLMTILLVGFAPVAWIFSQSTASIAWMGALHVGFWFVATMFGVKFMIAGFSHSSARSHGGLNVWILIFLLVAMQMTTTLRPILGRADTFLPTQKEFFIGHWMDCLNGK